MDDLSRSKYLNDIEYFSRKLEEDPSSKLFMPLAVALLKLNKYDDVIYYCAQGLEHYPDFAAAKTVMAQAYMGKGRVEDAKGLLKQVILLNRFNYKANKLMGDIYRSEQDMSRALDYYEKAWEISPEDKRLKDDIDELRNYGEEHTETIEVELPPEEEDNRLIEAVADEIAHEVKEDLAEYDFDQSVAELADDEAEQALAEIAAREAAQEEEADEGFDMDSIRSEDFEEEIKVSLLNSVNDKIIGDTVTLESESEDTGFPDIKDDERIELGSFADEVNRAEDEAVLSLVSGIASSALKDKEPEPVEDTSGLEEVSYEDLEDEDENAEPATQEELTADVLQELSKVPFEDSAVDENDAEPAPQEDAVDDDFQDPAKVSFEETEESEQEEEPEPEQPETAEDTETEEGAETPVEPSVVSYDEDNEPSFSLPGYSEEGDADLKYDDEHIAPAGDNFITERAAEAVTEAEAEDEPAAESEDAAAAVIPDEPVEPEEAAPAEEAIEPAPVHAAPAAPKSPQEKLAEAKKLMAEAQIEALEQALTNIRKTSQKDKYLAGSEE